MTIYEDKIIESQKNIKLEYLYFIDYTNYRQTKCILKKVPIVKETRQSFYVPKFSDKEFNTSEKWHKKNGEDYSKCYLVKKDSMSAKICDYGYTHRQYYQHPFLAKESFFIKNNAQAIGRKLAESQNPFLLRQIAHNLEMENLIELQYDDDINEKTEGENYARK